MESNILQKVESFNCRISDDVYWVPLETLGASQIKDRELQLLLKEPPEKKREHIRNLYDATALFVISNFHYCNDAVHLQDSEIVWEFHKSCYSAVKSNYGDCAACSSWLQYFVYGKYEDCGRLCMFRDTGSGHVVNYIKYAEWFYFVDFENYTDFLKASICNQTGQRADFVKSRYITAVLLRSRKIESYISFIRRYTRRVVKRYLFTKTSSLEIKPTARDMEWTPEKYIYFLYESDYRAIGKDETDLSYKIINLPEKIYERVNSLQMGDIFA